MSALFQAVAAALLAFVPDFTVALVAGALLGIGYGAFLSVDQALATQVLPNAATRGNPAGLTERQLAVLALVREGLTNTEIAEQMYLSMGTVKSHISSALTKLDFTNRIQLALLAYEAER